MYPVTVSIRRDLLCKSCGPDLAGLIDILWAHALPTDGLEHISKRMDDDTADFVLFMKSDTPEQACGAAIRICRRTLAASSMLADWKLIPGDLTAAFIRIS